MPRAMADLDAEPSHERIPWTRLMIGALFLGPALFRGGTWPWLTPALLLIGAATCFRVLRKVARARAPYELLLVAALVIVVLVPSLPLPADLRHAAAPELHGAVLEACKLFRHAPTSAQAGELASCTDPRSISAVPAGGIVEASRLVLIAIAIVIGAQLRWRFVAALVVLAGTFQAVAALLRGTLSAASVEALLASPDRPVSAALLGTFVNPNHQAAVHALAVFCALGLVVEAATGEEGPRTPVRARERLWVYTTAAALNLGLVATSLSRAAIVLCGFGLLMALAVLLRRRVPLVEGRGQTLRAALLTSVALLGVPLLIALRRGALTELMTLLPGAPSQPAVSSELGSSVAGDAAPPIVSGPLDWSGLSDDKLQHLRDGVQATSLSPWVGIGRGAYVHSSGLVAESAMAADGPSPWVVYAQLESTPLAWWVEAGPVGALLVSALAGLLLLRAWRSSMRSDASSRAARSVILVGFVTLAVHCLVEVPLEGSALAPLAVCLLASLGRGDATLSRPWPRWASIVLPILALGAAVAAAAVQPYLPTRARARALHDGTMVASPMHSAWLPLDPELHLALARDASARGAWATCIDDASLAAKLSPRRVEPQLLLLRCTWAQGDVRSAVAALDAVVERMRARALARTDRVAAFDPAVVAWMVRNIPADVLDAVIADKDDAWSLLARAALAIDPSYARRLAIAHREHPSRPRAVYLVRVRAELELGNPVAAVHFARELVRIEGLREDSALLLARALVARNAVGDLESARDVLRRALELQGAQADVLEETLISTSRRQPPMDPIELDALCSSLLARGADRQARSRRRKLCDELR